MAVRFPLRSNEVLLLLGLLLALPTLLLPVGIISGFQVETQPVYLFQQDPFYKLALLVPLLSALFLVLRGHVIGAAVTVVCHAALSLLFCIYLIFLYFRFHFGKPDPTWVALTFLLGYTLLFLGHLKTLFFPYEFLRAYQPGLPVRLQEPPSARETWGATLFIVAILIGFQGYYASQFLGQGPQYLLIIAGTIELTPLQRVQALLGTSAIACLGGLFLLLRRPGKKEKRVVRRGV
jgi:hypothetical protein